MAPKCVRNSVFGDHASIVAALSVQSSRSISGAAWGEDVSAVDADARGISDERHALSRSK
jgi:hypothetical protein